MLCTSQFTLFTLLCCRNQVNRSHKPTLIRVGSKVISKPYHVSMRASKSLPQNDDITPSHSHLKTGSLSTDGSTSPDSTSSSTGRKFSYDVALSRTNSFSSYQDNFASFVDSDFDPTGVPKLSTLNRLSHGRSSYRPPSQRPRSHGLQRSQSIQHRRVKEMGRENLEEMNR